MALEVFGLAAVRDRGDFEEHSLCVCVSEE